MGAARDNSGGWAASEADLPIRLRAAFFALARPGGSHNPFHFERLWYNNPVVGSNEICVRACFLQTGESRIKE